MLNLLRFNEKCMEKEFIDLFELQTRMKVGVESLFPTQLWLKAEVSAIKARSGGHCYLELSQSDGNGLIAKAGAIIWASKYRILAPYFESVTGSPIQVGMVLLVSVQINYSQLYGFSLIINDIDPEYSLGLKELERQRTIDRLRDEGLMDLQKGLSLPELPYRFAVISAEDAAGYRDFIRHLEENPYGFKVHTMLYPALMQGADCPSSIVSALDAVLEDPEGYDAVLVLRGGGSRLDLSAFDDYDLAAAISQYPLPVLTAIGHDQDHHVADMVAYEHVKTPTALADFILSIYEDEDARISSYQMRLKMAFSMKIAAMESALQVLQTRILSSDPHKIVERGYALVLDDAGVVVKGVGGRSRGDKVSLMFPDGTLDCVVDEVKCS